MKIAKLLGAILLISLPACVWLLQPGYYLSDDGGWMLIRFTSFYEELRVGEFPVRFLSRLNHGYGYPVATFLYPGFMYGASIIKATGISFIWSLKVFMIGCVGLSALFSYLWLRTLGSSNAARIGALSYIYHPYLLYDIYVRGSVGELFALSLLPLVLWALATKRIAISALSIGLFLISHNTLALLLFPLILFQSFWTLKTRAIFPLSIGIGLSAFFWIPALVELSITIFSQTTVSDWRSYFIPSVPYILIGIAPLVGLISLLMRGKSCSWSAYDSVFGLLLCISTFMVLPISVLFWDLFDMAQIIQFPFRFLALSIISGAYFITKSIDYIKDVRFTLALGVIICTTAGYSLVTFKPERVILPDSWYSTNEDTTTVHNEYMPIWVSQPPVKRAEERQQRIDDTTVLIHIIYWPGMTAVQNGTELPLDTAEPRGMIHVTTSSDDPIDIRMRETPLRIMANSITIGSLIALWVWIYLQKKRRS